MKKALALVGLLMLVGCTTAIKQGNVIIVSTKGFGLRVVTASSSTVTPEFDVGFFSTRVVTLPTATNAVINAPRVMEAFSSDSSWNPLKNGIQDNFGSGEVYIGGTNDTSKAIVPTPFQK